MKIDKYTPRRIHRWIDRLYYKMSGIDYVFDTVYCNKDDFHGDNYPSDMKELLAQFDLEDKHYVVYIKK